MRRVHNPDDISQVADTQLWLMAANSKFRSLNLGTVEGGLIFAAAAYETVVLAGNFVAGRKVAPPITDFLRTAAHDRRRRLIVWLLLGWLVDHVWRADPVPDQAVSV